MNLGRQQQVHGWDWLHNAVWLSATTLCETKCPQVHRFTKISTRTVNCLISSFLLTIAHEVMFSCLSCVNHHLTITKNILLRLLCFTRPQPLRANKIKVKVKFTLEQTTKDQRGKWRYSSTLSLTSALDRRWVFNATPRPLYPRKRLGSHWIGGWVGPPMASLHGCGKSCAPPPTGIRSSDRLARSESLYRLSWPGHSRATRTVQILRLRRGVVEESSLFWDGTRCWYRYDAPKPPPGFVLRTV